MRAPALLAALFVTATLATAAPTGPSLEHIGHVALNSATDVAFLGDLAVTASSTGTDIIDISDPTAPRRTAHLACRGIDVGLVAVNGRTVALVSSQSADRCPNDSRSGGLRLIDVTNPSNPIIGPQVDLVYGSHTHTPYGDSGLVLNSAYTLLFNFPATSGRYDGLQPAAHSRMEVIDVSDFWNPRVVTEWPFPVAMTGIGCHDIHAEPHLDRAICAAGTQTLVLDLSNVLEPVVTAQILNPSISFHHSADTAHGGDVLLIGDEWGGALPPGGCLHRGNAPQGAMWFYDLTTTPPLLLSFWAPPYTGIGLCTVHDFGVVPGRDLVVGAAYTAGTFMLDISNPAAPALLDMEKPSGANTWATRPHGDHLFSGDINRGFDVWRIV